MMTLKSIFWKFTIINSNINHFQEGFSAYSANYSRGDSCDMRHVRWNEFSRDEKRVPFMVFDKCLGDDGRQRPEAD
ncbi:MAG: hypothetical protein J6T46_03285, partial [Victivallales bacterium]|nr:hypothetical protein [Victivallales bacterium]